MFKLCLYQRTHSVLFSLESDIIYDIAVLTFLTLGTSQKSFDIADFFYFEETFRSECSERNERRGAKSGAKAGVPFGVAEAED